MRREKHDWKQTLERVGQVDDGANSRAEHPHRVGGPEISGAVLSQVDTLRLAGEICKRDRAREIRNQNPEKGIHVTPISAASRRGEGFP